MIHLSPNTRSLLHRTTPLSSAQKGNDGGAENGVRKARGPLWFVIPFNLEPQSGGGSLFAWRADDNMAVHRCRRLFSIPE